MSIEDLASSISANVQQAEQLGTAIAASKEQADRLHGQLTALAAESVAAQVNVCAEELRKAIGQVQGLKTQLEQCRTHAEAAKTA